MAGHIRNGGGRCSGLWRGSEGHEWSEGENQLPLQSERLPVIVFQAPFSYFNCLFYLENWLFLFRKSQIFWHFLFSQKILKFSNKSSKITKTNNLNFESKLLSTKSQKNKRHLSKQIEHSLTKKLSTCLFTRTDVTLIILQLGILEIQIDMPTKPMLCLSKWVFST